MVEVIGLREGIKEVKRLGFVNIIIRGDNKCVIKVLKGYWDLLWGIENIFIYVREDINCFNRFEVYYYFWEVYNVIIFF